MSHIVQWGDAAFPAWIRVDGVLVDLRNYDGGMPETWRQHLLRIGVPQGVIDSAAQSKPIGYALVPR